MKVYMSARQGCPVNRKHAGEECEACMWGIGDATNMDTLKEAVDFTETLDGWVVFKAYVDWGNSPVVIMRRLKDGQEMQFMGDPDNEEDWGFYENLTWRKGEKAGWWTTIDGQTIEHGLRVWDYNLDVAVVDVASSGTDSQYWDGWFDMKDLKGRRSSNMNGERMWVRHPTTREKA